MRARWILSLCLLTGCTSFERGALPHMLRWPPPSAAAGLSVSLEGLPDKFASGWRAALTRTLRESRGLSFAVGDAEPQLAYTNLPASVHPYLCSGDKEDNSLMVVCSAS